MSTLLTAEQIQQLAEQELNEYILELAEESAQLELEQRTKIVNHQVIMIDPERIQ